MLNFKNKCQINKHSFRTCKPTVPNGMTIHAAISIHNLHFTRISASSIRSFYLHFSSSNIRISAFHHTPHGSALPHCQLRDQCLNLQNDSYRIFWRFIGFRILFFAFRNYVFYLRCNKTLHQIHRMHRTHPGPNNAVIQWRGAPPLPRPHPGRAQLNCLTLTLTFYFLPPYTESWSHVSDVSDVSDAVFRRTVLPDTPTTASSRC